MYEPILMMVKNLESYAPNRDAILVETTTSWRANRLSKNPPQTIQSEKCRATSGHSRVRYLMDEYETILRKSPARC